jgi:hypothetical protein
MLSRLFGAAKRVGHRPIAKADVERMRWTEGGAFVMPRQNPGIRVEPDFVTAEEEASLVCEMESASASHGYQYDGDQRVHTLGRDGGIESTMARVVNNTRVTGRLERPYADGTATPPSWGYGDAFDRSAVPPTMLSLAERIVSCGHYDVGPLRDITINGRSNSFFQLDPHVDPAADGMDVFILSALSSCVLTFSPPDEVLARLGGERRPRDGNEIGLKSWTSRDIDVLVQPRTLLHFTGAARFEWQHAIRAGVQVDQPGQPPLVCDWWGANDYLLRRNERRWSIVMAFGASANQG